MTLGTVGMELIFFFSFLLTIQAFSRLGEVHLLWRGHSALLSFFFFIIHAGIHCMNFGGPGTECYGLNVSVPPESHYVEALTPNIMVCGGGALMGQLSLELKS